MKKQVAELIQIKSVGQYHHLLHLPKPQHPLMSIMRFEGFPAIEIPHEIRFTFDFYTITIKENCTCKSKYGQTMFDFDDGVMSFFAPKQVSGVEPDFYPPTGGWLLIFHPDLLRNYPLGQKIKDYGFFDYSVAEALILSEKEQESIYGIFANISKEYNLPIDNFSQDVIISQLDLLLTYSNRYYHRQFITRKTPNSDLLTKAEAILNECFAGNKIEIEGLPTVTLLAEKLHLSPKYLSEMLRIYTGKTAQQHIHERLIEKAKEKLSATNLSVSEIAYELGFAHSQSFSKLFKSKLKMSPLEFRMKFN